MMTNGGMKRESGYMERILEWTKDKMKRDGMNCLKILFLNVCGMEMKREDHKLIISTGRRMREVWKDEGKDSEGRREWEKRWREGVDIITEEDVMETCVMHLCIPDYTKKENEGLIVPSESSLRALNVLLNTRRSDDHAAYHFPVYDMNDVPSNVVIIQNVSLEFDLNYSDAGRELKSLITSLKPNASIEQVDFYAVVRVTLNSPDDAQMLVQEMNGREFHGRHLIVRRGVGEKGEKEEDENDE